MIDIILYLLCGGALGFLIGLTGIGSGVLAVPVLILVVGLEPITAVGTASLFAVLTKIYAVYRHYRQDTINWGVGLRFLAAALPGVVASAVLVKLGKANLSPSGVAALQDAIGVTILIVIGFSLVVLLLDVTRFGGGFLATGRGKALGVVCVVIAGAVMGATSIGGILIIPSLLLFYRETARYVGTSLVIGVLVMLVMSIIYAFLGGGESGDVNLRVAAIMAAGSLIGTHQGSVLSKQFAPRRLQWVVFGVVLIAVLMMIVNTVL